jgi:hyperosmotically inducible periplasmic protein
MKRMYFRMATLGGGLMLGTVLVALPSTRPGNALPTLEQPAPTQEDPQSAPDNTKMNQGDADKSADTADHQKATPEDREMSKKIRSSIYQDKSLSTYAHNVKIISRNGSVTLRGPVRSDDERADIEAKAAAIAGQGNVHSELRVAPPKS